MSLSKNNVFDFFKKEPILCTALALALLTSIFSLPKMGYINFKVLILLFNLMVVEAAFSDLKVLDSIAISLLKKCKSKRGIEFSIVFITFIAAMIVTNDVALLTFVPITLIIGKKTNVSVMKLVILQTLAANLGSSFTPMGNPHNLYTYYLYEISPINFLKLTLPMTLLSIIFLIILMLRGKNEILQFKLEDIKIKNKNKVVCFSILLLIILLSVFQIVSYKWVFLITLIMVFCLDFKLLKKIDYSLLITFICFFIFTGNISHMDMFRNFMEKMLNGSLNTYLAGIFASQIISNVPATMLLAGFTQYPNELILALDIGGMGTLIASLASIISYRLYIGVYKEESNKYLKKFTAYNIIGLVVFIPVVYILNFILF
ncbi:anion transporter [Clostridium tarantellae]|uniref:Anion transporter n=1 Tax=Clostridium tarantellae TaxID=39493 RepID=A0A6I1MMV7_9CLOT|nr:anion transporter [Clostridium tarantellae]